MSVPNYQLFYGFLVNEAFHQALNEVDEGVRLLFVQNDEKHLHKVEHKGNVYLGKFLGNKSHLASLPDIEKNIYSLLNRLVPQFSYEDTDLLLFPAKTDSNS